MGSHVTQNYVQLSANMGGAPLPAVLECLSAPGPQACVIAGHRSLTDGQVIALCAVLPLANTFEELAFQGLTLNINSWVAIADASSKSKTLRKLRLRDCAFAAGQGLATLGRALGGCSLVTLDIEKCQLGDDAVAALAEGALLKSDQLRELRLVGCGLSDDGVCRLAKVLESVGMDSGLKALDLSYNRIGDRGATALAVMLVSEPAHCSLPLQSLDLAGNMVSDVGCSALARAAKGALALSRLNISNNLATGATLTSLADTLRFNTGTLKEVLVAGARSAEDAVTALIRAAQRNNSLMLLDLRGVPLADEAVGQLCALMRHTASLQTLLVDVASRIGADAIAAELPNCRSLSHLTLGGPVPDELRAHITRLLAANQARRHTSAPAHSPQIHAWIENATLGKAVSGHTAADAIKAAERSLAKTSSVPNQSRSPRSDAGSAYSRGTHTTHRTNTTYLSFQFSQMSRRTGISSSPVRLSTSLAAGGAAEKAAVIFRKHDVNQDNYLNKDEMLAALQEVGVFNGIRARHVGKLLEHEFKKADWDKDGRISLQDFTAYYEKVAKFQTQLAREGRIKSASHVPPVPEGAESNPALKRVFRNYCKYALGQGRVYGQEAGSLGMNTQQLHRLVQDAGFVEPEGRLTTTAIDVVFCRYRPPTSRRLGYKEFVEALAAIAYEAGLQFEDVMVALGCADPLSPHDSLQAGEAGPGLKSAFDHDGMESAFSGAPSHGLASIQELPTPQATPLAARTSVSRTTPGGPRPSMPPGLAPGPAPGVGPNTAKAKKTKKGTAGKLKSAVSSQGHPLYESQTLLQHGAAAAPGTKTAALEARVSVLEARLAAGMGQGSFIDRASSGAGIIGGGPDAGVTAASIAGRLSKLEAAVSQAAVKQEQMDGLSRRMESLQVILSRLADEIASVKAASPGLAGRGGGDASGVAVQVESLSRLVKQLGGEVHNLQGRVDGLGAQVASVSLEQRSLAMRERADAGPGSVADAAGLGALEKRLTDRASRFENALMQVARQVDVLDAKINGTADAR